VGRGESFRDAYRYVGGHLDELETRTPEESISSRTSTGTAGNLALGEIESALQELEERLATMEERSGSALRALAGDDVRPTSLWDT
jgi:hypothetical protein